VAGKNWTVGKQKLNSKERKLFASLENCRGAKRGGGEKEVGKTRVVIPPRPSPAKKGGGDCKKVKEKAGRVGAFFVMSKLKDERELESEGRVTKRAADSFQPYL